MNFSYIVIDLETTGLHSLVNGVCEIAAVDSNGRTFHTYVKPFASAVYNAKAMLVNGLNETFLADQPSETDAMIAFDEWLAEAPEHWYFVGANPNFDQRFLSAIQKRTGISLDLDYHLIDLASMSLLMHLQGKISLYLINNKPVMSVDSMAQAVGLARSSSAHSAAEDVILERDIFVKLVELG